MISDDEMHQPVPSFHRVMLTFHNDPPFLAAARHVNKIQCHPPAGDAEAHFSAFYALLNRTTPHDLRQAVLSYLAYLKARARWKALRAYWRARWFVVWWHALTAKEMAHGGKAEKRNRASYEADFSFSWASR